jgi:DNA polymerase III subunit epsilon
MDYLPFIAVDVETANYDCANICQFGFAAFLNGALLAKNAVLINPECEFELRFKRIHGITREMVSGSPSWGAIHPLLSEYLNAEIVLSHTYFDKDAIGKACARYALPLPTPKTWVDTCSLARHIWPDLVNHKLPTLAAHFNIPYHAHDAAEDARCAGEIFVLAVNASGQSMQQVIKKYAMSWSSSVPIRVKTTSQPISLTSPPMRRAVTPPAPDELLDLRHGWPPQTEAKNKQEPSVPAPRSEQAPTTQPIPTVSVHEPAASHASRSLPFVWAMLIFVLLALLFYLGNH